MYEHYASFEDALAKLKSREEELSRIPVLTVTIGGKDAGALFNDEFRMVVVDSHHSCFYIPKTSNLLTESLRGEYVGVLHFIDSLHHTITRMYNELSFLGTNTTTVTVGDAHKKPLFSFTIYLKN